MDAFDYDQPADPSADTAMTLSREVLTLGTEWAEAGRVRFRRQIVSETRTIEVTVRREELVIETEDIGRSSDEMVGTAKDGPVTDPPPPDRPPLVIVLQEEVPVVTVRLQPYERVTVRRTIAERTGRVAARLRHEEVELRVQEPVNHD